MAALVASSNVGSVAAGATISRASGVNLSVGSLLVVVVSSFKSATNDPFVVGDISQSAGTATLGAWSLDVQINENSSSGGSTYLNTAIFTAVVTGAGSCTVQVSGMPAGAFSWMSLAEFTGSWGSGRLTASNSASATSGTAPNPGSVSTGGPALIIAAAATYSGANPVTYTEDAEYTSIYASLNGAADHTGESVYRITTGDVTDAAAWTAPTTHGWNAVVAVYKEGSTPFFARKYDPTLWHLLHNTR